MHPIITRFGRWRQETCRFEDSLYYNQDDVSIYTHTQNGDGGTSSAEVFGEN